MYKAHSLSRIHADWSCLVSQSFRLHEPGFRAEVFQFASRIMGRAKVLLEEIIDNLLTEGYRFVEPNKVHQAPDSDLWDWIREYEEGGIYLPVSLQAWLAVVGNVDLRGTHPSWPKPGYVFDEMPATSDVLYTDPLVVDVSGDYVAYLRREWETNIRDEGSENVGPFLVAISPDHIHKANVSGGPPYEVPAQTPAVDSLLYNERHCTSFTDYIRIALRWGGFPGLEYSPDKEDVTKGISRGISI